MKATALLFSGAMLTVGTLLAAAPASAQQFHHEAVVADHQ